MAGIIPDNFSIDIGQQLMSNIVNLYAQKQQLDEKRKLEDERYKREQEMWEQRQVSTEEREKRMAEYQTQLKLDAQTKSMLNAYEIQEGINFLKFKNDYLYKVKNDPIFRKSEIERVGSEENLNNVVENLNNLTPSDVFNKTKQYYDLSKDLIETNIKIVYEEKSLENYRKLPQDIQNNINLKEFLNSSESKQAELIQNAMKISTALKAYRELPPEIQYKINLEEFLNSSITEQQEMINSASKMINKESSELLNKIYGQTQITTMQPTSELDKLELELSDKRKKLHMLLQTKNQTPQIKEAIKNIRAEIEKLQSLITSEKLVRERKKQFPPQTRKSEKETKKEENQLNLYKNLNDFINGQNQWNAGIIINYDTGDIISIYDKSGEQIPEVSKEYKQIVSAYYNLKRKIPNFQKARELFIQSRRSAQPKKLQKTKDPLGLFN